MVMVQIQDLYIVVFGMHVVASNGKRQMKILRVEDITM
jgi:hypothetical protein